MNQFQDRVSITEFGAVPGDRAPVSGIVQKAIDEMAGTNGGTVVIPAGEFICGSLELRSNITLYLAPGARLIASTNPQDFPLVTHRYEGIWGPVHKPLIGGNGVSCVSVCGRGTIDGRGAAWWSKARAGELDAPRPLMISLRDSDDIRIEGITIVDAPAWNISPVHCRNIVIDGVTIISPRTSVNTDGINPDGCSNVRIANCNIDVGDDCIAIKSGTEESTEPDAHPCENITITNCTMGNGNGGVVIGSEMSGGVRHVVVSNCTFIGTHRGIRIKSQRGRGGTVEDICISNIVMRNVIVPFVMNMFYHWGPKGRTEYVQNKKAAEVTRFTPRVRNIRISNVIAHDVRGCAGFIYGLPEMPIEDITLSHITIDVAYDGVPRMMATIPALEQVQGDGFVIANARRCRLFDIVIRGQRNACVTTENVSQIRIEDICGDGDSSEATRSC